MSRWSTEDYHAGVWTKLLLALGGSPYRCEYCRINFVSFRRLKQKYRRRRVRSSTVGLPAGSSATDDIARVNTQAPV